MVNTVSLILDAAAGTFTQSNNTIVIKDGAITIPTGNTAQRSQNPIAGMMRFNTETANVEGYMGTDWVNIQP